MEEKGLLQLKRKIEEAKSKESELRGRRDYLMSEMKRMWDCDTIKEAQSLIKEMESNLSSMDKRIAAAIEEIEERMGIS